MAESLPFCSLNPLALRSLSRSDIVGAFSANLVRLTLALVSLRGAKSGCVFSFEPGIFLGRAGGALDELEIPEDISLRLNVCYAHSTSRAPIRDS